MEQEPHVPNTEGGHCGNFLVTELMLKLESHDFALVAREVGQQAFDVIGSVARNCRGVGTEPRRGLVIQFDFRQRSHTVSLSLHVVSAIATDGEEPRTEMSVHRVWRLFAQPKKRVLNHIARRFQVTGEAERVADQRGLELFEALPKELLTPGIIKPGDGDLGFGLHSVLV